MTCVSREGPPTCHLLPSHTTTHSRPPSNCRARARAHTHTAHLAPPSAQAKRRGATISVGARRDRACAHLTSYAPRGERRQVPVPDDAPPSQHTHTHTSPLSSPAMPISLFRRSARRATTRASGARGCRRVTTHHTYHASQRVAAMRHLAERPHGARVALGAAGACVVPRHAQWVMLPSYLRAAGVAPAPAQRWRHDEIPVSGRSGVKTAQWRRDDSGGRFPAASQRVMLTPRPQELLPLVDVLMCNEHEVWGGSAAALPPAPRSTVTPRAVQKRSHGSSDRGTQFVRSVGWKGNASRCCLEYGALPLSLRVRRLFSFLSSW